MVKASLIKKIRQSRSYTYAELANLTGKCEATVRGWGKEGMHVLNEHKPHLVIGSDAKEFLNKRFHANKQNLAIGEVQCFTCRDRRSLEPGLAEFTRNGPNGWRLVGLCSVCGNICNRIVKKDEIPLHAEKLGVEPNIEIQD